MKCNKPAIVRQQMTHAHRLELLRKGEAHGQPANRYLCEEHADVIDPHWITLERVFLDDVESALLWTRYKCEWEDEDV